MNIIDQMEKKNFHYQSCSEFLFLVAGNQGFPISAVIDEPNMRVKGFTTAETSVHLICQRNQGIQNPPSQYLIINCQIKVSNGFGSVSATIPDLMNYLSAYITQVRMKIIFCSLNMIN